MVGLSHWHYKPFDFGADPDSGIFSGILSPRNRSNCKSYVGSAAWGGLRSPSTLSMYYIAAGEGHHTKSPRRKQKERKTKDSVVKQHCELPRVDKIRYFGIFIKVRSAKCKWSVDHAKRLLYRAANGIFAEASQEVLLNLLLTRSTVWTRTFASDEQTCDLLIFNQ